MDKPAPPRALSKGRRAAGQPGSQSVVPRILLLMDTESYRAGDFLRAAQRLGLSVLAGTNQPHVTEALAPERTLAVDYADEEASLAAIAAAHARSPFSAIVALDDTGTALAARASTALKLPSNPQESVRSASNKLVFREIMQAAGLPGPTFRAASVDDDPARLAREVVFPCVLKPVFLNASRGVIRADDVPGFVRAFTRIKALLDDPGLRAKGGDAAGRVLIESYLPGVEVALEGSIADGELRVLAVLDKPDPLEGPYFEETLFITPSRHGQAVQRELARQGQAAVDALGLRQGPVHAEFRVHQGAVTLLELAPRSIGGNCARMLQFGAGQSLEEVILRQAVGHAEPPPPRERRAAGVMMIPIPAGGILRDHAGSARAAAVAGIEGVEISIPVGQPVVPLPEGRRYLGFIYAKGPTPAFVEQALRKAHACLSFDIRPE
ncbi:MAG: ATP-grasp domain-containing protein [Candidatus Lambdaproteobacteria bacterium]|nr:ATP-grasp domain-containing protein [Candidatus Lambdaproteobacteria bacterium]